MWLESLTNKTSVAIASTFRRVALIFDSRLKAEQPPINDTHRLGSLPLSGLPEDLHGASAIVSPQANEMKPSSGDAIAARRFSLATPPARVEAGRAGGKNSAAGPASDSSTDLAAWELFEVPSYDDLDQKQREKAYKRSCELGLEVEGKRRARPAQEVVPLATPPLATRPAKLPRKSVKAAGSGVGPASDSSTDRASWELFEVPSYDDLDQKQREKAYKRSCELGLEVEGKRRARPAQEVVPLATPPLATRPAKLPRKSVKAAGSGVGPASDSSTDRASWELFEVPSYDDLDQKQREKAYKRSCELGLEVEGKRRARAAPGAAVSSPLHSSRGRAEKKAKTSKGARSPGSPMLGGCADEDKDLDPLDATPQGAGLGALECESCGGCDMGSASKRSVLLECSTCGAAHHMNCLAPPLTRKPRGSWSCPDCEDAAGGEEEPMEEDCPIMDDITDYENCNYTGDQEEADEEEADEAEPEAEGDNVEAASTLLGGTEYDDVDCKECGGRGEAECMVLCDFCGRGFHATCVGLDAAPEGEWFCSSTDCVSGQARRDQRRGSGATEAAARGKKKAAVPRFIGKLFRGDGAGGGPPTAAEAPTTKPHGAAKPAAKAAPVFLPAWMGAERGAGAGGPAAPALPAWDPSDPAVINRVRAALHVSSMPDHVLGREKQIAEVSSFCASHLDGGTPGSMYVSGLPGTGKSLSVRRVVEGATGGHTRIYINCMAYSDPQKVFARILEEIGDPASKSGCADTQVAALRRRAAGAAGRGKMLLVVLDEIDHLLTRAQGVLYEVFALPLIPGSRCVVIGIANSIDLTERFLPRLKARGCRPATVTFGAYTPQQIAQVLEQRVGALPWRVFQPQALQMCARKVASVTGDMRRALNICDAAIGVFLQACRDATAPPPAGGSSAAPPRPPPDLVKLPHMVAALGQSFKSDEVERMKSLPQQQQIALCAAVLLFRSSGRAEAALGDVNAKYLAICKKAGAPHLSNSEFSVLVANLADQALITIGSGADERQRRLALKIREEDVAFALQGDKFFQMFLESEMRDMV